MHGIVIVADFKPAGGGEEGRASCDKYDSGITCCCLTAFLMAKVAASRYIHHAWYSDRGRLQAGRGREDGRASCDKYDSGMAC